MRFSERSGHKKVKQLIQTDYIDADLRNGLWTAFTDTFWDEVTLDAVAFPGSLTTFVHLIWRDYFKLPVDTVGQDVQNVYARLRKYFFECAWYEVYDFVEFAANEYPVKFDRDAFIQYCNSLLERELSAYRFVGSHIVRVTDPEEVSAIEGALKASETFPTVRHHLESAIAKLADRKHPDYRNAIKEAISAVESLCSLITGKKGTLPDALKRLEGKVEFHPALKTAFDKLYGYTSDAEGIRHALLDQQTLDLEDARFMLVACSAFVGYLIVKADKAGITFKKEKK